MRMKNNKGITLIALVITIIVMLILVGVTVNVALNGGLFTTTKQAAKETQIEADRETLLPAVLAAIGTDGNVNKNNIKLPDGWSESEGIYTSPNGNQFTVSDNGEIKYIGEGENPGGDITEPGYKTEIPGLADGVTVVPYEELEKDIKQAVDDGKIQTVLKETINGEEIIAVVPTGFEISTVDGENSISGGLVIRDGANEFVFIPCVETFSDLSIKALTGKLEGVYVADSQTALNHYYGSNFFVYPDDFNYEQDKKDIETSINKYKGFYVGRYETTIDENGIIGSTKNTTVLTADKSIPQTNDKAVRWYGLYKVQKDMYKDDRAVFSTMISYKESGIVLDFTGVNEIRELDSYTTQPDLSGAAYRDSDPKKYDVSKNVYDLTGNVTDVTLGASGNNLRLARGGNYTWNGPESLYNNNAYPNSNTKNVRQ